MLVLARGFFLLGGPRADTARGESRCVMNGKQWISHECMDRILEWVRCHCPCGVEEKEFVRGLFFIVEEEVRSALSREREEKADQRRRASAN
jgi:hypothetical protein